MGLKAGSQLVLEIGGRNYSVKRQCLNSTGYIRKQTRFEDTDPHEVNLGLIGSRIVALIILPLNATGKTVRLSSIGHTSGALELDLTAVPITVGEGWQSGSPYPGANEVILEFTAVSVGAEILVEAWTED